MKLTTLIYLPKAAIARQLPLSSTCVEASHAHLLVPESQVCPVPVHWRAFVQAAPRRLDHLCNFIWINLASYLKKPRRLQQSL